MQVAFLDDILVASETERQHEIDVRLVLTRLAKHHLKINLKKCEYAKKQIEFLGHLVTADGIKPLPSKVDAILNFKKPQITKELRRFIAMVNFYRRFIPNAIVTQQKLQALIKGNIKNDKSIIEWTDEAYQAFTDYKEMLANATLLVHPAKNATIALEVDASDTAIGAVLHQVEKHIAKPLAFFSRKLNNAQLKYSTYDRELLAI